MDFRSYSNNYERWCTFVKTTAPCHNQDSERNRPNGSAPRETRRGHLKFSCVNSCGFSDALRAIDSPPPSPPLLCITLHPRNKRYSSARVRVRERVQLDSYYTSNPIFSLSNYTNNINLCPSVKKSRWRFYVRGRLKPNL